MEKNMDTNFDFNKTGKFDFGKVGKRMPYSTPEGFFKEMEANILEQVKNDELAPVDTAEETISEEGDLDGCNSCGCIGGSTPGTQHRFLSLFFPAFTGE